MGARENMDGCDGGGPGAVNPSSGTTMAVAPAAPIPVAVTLPMARALKHDPGLSLQWSAEEQAILEEGLTMYALDTIVLRYAKIALKLDNKTARDVAMRCRWMTKKVTGKRRKEDNNMPRRSKDKKERVTVPMMKPSTHMGPRPNASSYAMSMLPRNDDDNISLKAIGGRIAQLLRSNADAFAQIRSNFANSKIQDNVALFYQIRDNLHAILNNSANDMPEIMKQMPPLSVQINEELANLVFMGTTMPMQP